MSRHSLVLGGIELTDPLGPFSVEADVDFGEPEPVLSAIASLVMDGALERTDRVENREIALVVRIEAPDGIALAEAEQRLARELYRENTLAWTPPDGFGPTTVWDVQTSRMGQAFDDYDELMRVRRYRVVLRCRPWGRSANPVTQTFASGTATVTTLDPAAALTNWTVGSVGFTADVASYDGGNRVRLTQTEWLTGTYARAGDLDVDYTGTKPVTPNYLALDVAEVWPGGRPSSVRGPLLTQGGSSSTIDPNPVAAQRVGLFMRYFYRRLAPLTSAPIRVSMRPRYEDGTIIHTTWNIPTYYLGGLSTSTAIPAASLFLADVKGSARTEASLRIAQGGLGGGRLAVYHDRTMLTHGWLPDQPTTWGNLPEGSYSVWGALAAASWRIRVNGEQTVSRLATASMPVGPIGVVHLGGTRSGRVVAAPTFTISGNGGTFTPWEPSALFRVADDAELIWARTSAADSEVIIDTPSPEFPRGGIWRNGRSLFTNDLVEFDFPRLSPGLEALWVAWRDTATLGVEMTHYPRWHSNAAE